MSSEPLLSICIPTYNRSRNLSRLMEALIAQVQQSDWNAEIELVISDNCSSDDTQEKGEQWAVEYPFVRYFRNTWNIGGDPNHLRSVARATGRYAWIIGDDDLIQTGGVDLVLSRLNPGVTQLFLNFRCVSPAGNVLVPSRIDPTLPDGLTTLEVIKRVGFMSVFALISAHVFDRKMFLATEAKSLLKLSPWYVLNTALLIAFHNQECHLVREPVIDYTVGNERLPMETAIYSRVLLLLNTLNWLEDHKKIDVDFLNGCYETGAGANLTALYFREELYGSLFYLTGFWALPGRQDWNLIRNFIDRGPGFAELRNNLKQFFLDDFKAYLRHQKPMIHFWKGKAWFPAMSLMFSTNDPDECVAYDALAGSWPEEFAHESILISQVPEDEVDLEHVDVFMAPFPAHRSASTALNSAFRKVLAPRVLIFDNVVSPAISEVISLMGRWHSQETGPEACLLFQSSEAGSLDSAAFIGLYLKRNDFIRLGGFENYFQHWTRRQLLVDAAYRLKCDAYTIDGTKLVDSVLQEWFVRQMPFWVRALRLLRTMPVSEHGLNISHRAVLG